MKFMHIADLHLGKMLSDVSFVDDQRFILMQMLDIASAQHVDAVLIAGDIYQKSSPPAEAMALFDWFLTSLTEKGLKVFIISGNHDSAQRVSYFSSLVRSSGVFVSENFDGHLQRITLADEFGELDIHLLPFLKPIYVRRWLPAEKISTYQDAVCAVLRNSDIDNSRRNILLCHQFITGSETSDSEEKAVGGLDNIDAAVFDAFDYVALGHIHKPQPMTRASLRYSGSPLKYSFSESNHKKSVVILEMNEKGSLDITTVPLQPKRDMRLIEGMLGDIMQAPYSEDYVWVTVNDELVPPDAKLMLSTVFPNMLKFSISNSRTKYDSDVTAADSLEDKSVLELFSDFYRTQNNDREPSEAHMQLLTGILKEMEDDRREAD